MASIPNTAADRKSDIATAEDVCFAVPPKEKLLPAVKHRKAKAAPQHLQPRVIDPVAASLAPFQSEGSASSISTKPGETVPDQAKPPSDISFPPTAIVGSLGEAARELTRGREVPVEFVYAALVTILGLHCSKRLTLQIGMKHDTRLYTVLYGESGDTKKSSALEMALDFFDSLGPLSTTPYLVEGLGSAEGLMLALGTNKRILLGYDELRSLVDKTKIQGSVLLSAIAQLYEHENYDNFTKEHPLSIKGAKLAIVGCATAGTYETMWTQEAIDIGLPNRLFLVSASRQPKILFPGSYDKNKLDAIRVRLKKQIARLPLTLPITLEAQNELKDWYERLPAEPQAKRLDTILRSLLPLLALIVDKNEVDLETAQMARNIMNYEFRLRQIADPVDAEGPVAKLEEKIRRVLAAKGQMSESRLKRAVHYTRYGIEKFKTAIKNLRESQEVYLDDKKLWNLRSALLD